MKPINQQLVGNKFAGSRLLFWMSATLLLVFAVKNVQSDEITSKVTDYQIEISGFAFIPKELKVNAGDTITWINRDLVPHNIFDSTHKKSISPDLATGEAYTLVVESPMLYECGLHPSMKGNLSLYDTP
jgi:plastocyanin